MLKTIGRRPAAEDPAGRLAECHEKIRHFLGVARRLAEAIDPEPQELASAAEAVRDYFVSSFTLHARDEDEVVIPWLAGRSPELDAVMNTLRSDHADHELGASTLVRLCRTLAHEPHRLDETRGELAATLDLFAPALERHLVREEEILFPALRALDPDEQEMLVRALRRARG